MNDSDTLTLIVVGAESDDTGTASSEGIPGDAVELESIPDRIRGFFGKEKKVELSTLNKRMEEVQGEVDQLLGGLKKPSGGYHLAEVQVSLAISGSGSIGVATVGAEASIALTFAPSP
jgi:hypothetical protein